MAVITSRQHPIVKTFREIARGEPSRALLDGWHLLHEASAAGLDLDTVAICGQPPTQDDADLIDRVARGSHVIVVSVSSAVMNALSPVRTPTGVAALVKRPPVALSQVLAPAPSLVVVAVDVQDPGNAGAIIRSAEAGGATGVILAGASADAWGWKALRAAMGSTFRVPVIQQPDAAIACDLLRKHRLSLLATVPRDGASMYETDLRGDTALLLGAEGAGLSAEILRMADRQITIPMRDPVESLNVAVAAGVLVFEAKRQRAG